MCLRAAAHSFIESLAYCAARARGDTRRVDSISLFATTWNLGNLPGLLATFVMLDSNLAAQDPQPKPATAPKYLDLKFNLKNGRDANGEGYSLKTYPVERRSDGIFVGLEEAGGGFFKKWF